MSQELPSPTERPAHRESQSLPASSGAVFSPKNVSSPQTTSLPAGGMAAASLVQVTGAAPFDPEPYYRPYTATESSSQSASRSLGVQSMLNPSQSDPKNAVAIAPDSPRTRALRDTRQADPAALLTPPITSPKSRKRSQRSALGEEASVSSQSAAPRRTLTPFSPARRAESLGTRRSLGGSTTTGQQMPLAPAGSRVYTAEPGLYPESDIPPLPVPNIRRPSLQEFYSAEGPAGGTRPPGGGHALSADVGNIARQSESPGTSQSSYSYISQPSPIFSHGSVGTPQQAYQPLQPAPSGALAQQMTATGIAGSHRHQVPGQTGLQMTLNTDQGTMVVPVDVQQASRTANEKRKRNASASARFRARRKEKEKEASHTIVTLERQLRDITEERDFYRSERDYFQELASRHVQYPPRAASPASRRAANLLPPIGNESAAPQFQEQFRDVSEPSARAPLRRRTAEHVRLSSGSVSASPMLPPQIPFPSQHPIQPPSLPPVHVPPSLPNPFTDPRLGRPAGQPQQPPPPPPVTRSHSFDPFRSERFDRSWDPGR